MAIFIGLAKKVYQHEFSRTEGLCRLLKRSGQRFFQSEGHLPTQRAAMFPRRLLNLRLQIFRNTHANLRIAASHITSTSNFLDKLRTVRISFHTVRNKIVVRSIKKIARGNTFREHPQRSTLPEEVKLYAEYHNSKSNCKAALVSRHV